MEDVCVSHAPAVTVSAPVITRSKAGQLLPEAMTPAPAPLQALSAMLFLAVSPSSAE